MMKYRPALSNIFNKVDIDFDFIAGRKVCVFISEKAENKLM